MSKKTSLRSVAILSCISLCVLSLWRQTSQAKAAETTKAAAHIAVRATRASSPARRQIGVGPASPATVAASGAVFVAAAHAAPSTQSPPQGDKPVEQTRKNIQVIKGLPEAQLFPLMNFVSAALGVRCGYCHVRNGKDPKTNFDNWVWESDDKEEKRTARRMMQMVLAVNQSNRADFRNNNVTCYTCHRSNIKPSGLPPLPLTVSGHEGGGAAAAVARTASEPLPSVEQIVDKYVSAVGGAAPVAGIKTLVMKGTREASQDRIWPLEITVKGPDKYLAVMTIPKQGEVKQSYSGADGWVMNPNGLRAASAGELASLKRGAEVYDLIKVRLPLPKARVAGRDKIGDREVYVVESKPADGITENLYFETQTGLLLRKLKLTDTVLLPIPEQTDFEDYRDVGGVKVPFVIRISSIDTFNSSTRKFTEIKPNVPLDDAIFRMPAAPAAAAPAAAPPK